MISYLRPGLGSNMGIEWLRNRSLSLPRRCPSPSPAGAAAPGFCITDSPLSHAATQPRLPCRTAHISLSLTRRRSPACAAAHGIIFRVFRLLCTFPPSLRLHFHGGAAQPAPPHTLPSFGNPGIEPGPFAWQSDTILTRPQPPSMKVNQSVSPLRIPQGR